MLQLAGAVQSSAIGTVLSLALMIAGAVLAGVGVLHSFRDVPSMQPMAVQACTSENSMSSTRGFTRCFF